MVQFASMARHVDVVRTDRTPPRQQVAEARLTQRAELLALALAGLAGSVLHGGLPSLGRHDRRGHIGQRRRHFAAT